MENEILETLKEMREAQKELMAKQEEAIQFLRDEAEKSKKIREEAIALQRQAMERAKRISYIAVPLILICAGLILYLLLKYRIL
jgi:hypothetical protein